MMYLSTIIYILHIRIAIWIVLACLIKIAKLFYPLGLRIISPFIRFGYIVQELALIVINAFIKFGNIIRVLGLIGFLQYVFVFKLMNDIQLLRIFVIILSSVISRICFFDQHIDTIVLFLFINDEFDSNTVMMNSGEGSAGNNIPDGSNNSGGVPNPNGGGNNPGGGPNPNGADNAWVAYDPEANNRPWRPFNYEHLYKENESRYSSTYVDPSTVLPNYDPAENKPPKNDRELSVLLDHRFSTQVRKLGYANWNVQKAFPSESSTDIAARCQLFCHIYEHQADLKTAFKQMDAGAVVTPWDKVEITSFLINSLNRSNK